MKKSLGEYFNIANKITDLVGKFLVKNFGSTKKMFHKYDVHYGIKEDIICNKIYEDYLEKFTPEISIYSEEGKQNLNGELTWVIDPIDGTGNYRVGNPFFNTQICLLQNGAPVLAIINAPVLKQLFTAQINQGAYLNGKKISVSKTQKVKEALLSMSRGSLRGQNVWLGKTLPKMLNHFRSIRVLGSCGLELAYLAFGSLDIQIDLGNKIYDLAPGVLLIRESGGIVLNYQGKQWTIQDKTLLAGNKKLVSETLKLNLLS